jgi:hypothetical protein
MPLKKHSCVHTRQSGAMIESVRFLPGCCRLRLTTASTRSDAVAIKWFRSRNYLDPTDRAAVVMYYWYDFSYQEISQSLSLTVSAVKSRLHRARRAMSDQWLEEQPPQARSAQDPDTSGAHSKRTSATHQQESMKVERMTP